LTVASADDPVARRVFHLQSADSVERIEMTLSPAHPDPSDPEHTVECTVTILRAGVADVRHAHGVDSVQAVLNGLYLMRKLAIDLNEHGVLFVDGEPWAGSWWPEDHAAGGDWDRG